MSVKITETPTSSSSYTPSTDHILATVGGVLKRIPLSIIGSLSSLTTTEKGSLVGAINENADKISSYIIVEETTGTGSIASGVANFTFPIASQQGYVPILGIWQNCEYSGSFCPHLTSKVLTATDTSFSLSAWSSNTYTSPSTTAKAYVLYAKA